MIVTAFYRYILISISTLGIMGCHSTYKLSKDDLKWNPYKGSELLIFESNQGSIDTIFVGKVSKDRVPNDPLAIAPKYHEVLDVIVKHSNPVSINTHNYLENSFLNLYATSDRNTIIRFDFAAKNSWFYAESYYKNDLNKLPVQKLTIKNLTYEDVIKLEPQSMKFYERDEFVTAVYWSKSKGYVRYDLKNGIYWELQ